MASGILKRKTTEQQRELESRLEELSKPSVEFFVLLGSSTTIAILGLFLNSAAVIIGAMIIAPLMRPLMGLALGSISADQKLIFRSLMTLLAGTFCGLSIGYFGSLLLHSIQFTPEILGRTHPNLLDLGVALAAGGVGAYCQSKEEIRDTLAGVAISVALVPPLSVVGIGLARADLAVAGGAALLYLTNLIGITVAAAGVLIVMGYSPLNRARNAILTSIAFMSALLVPLGLSMRELVLENELSSQINSLLKERTFTFKSVRLHSVEVRRFKSPMDVVATVYGGESQFTPKQVKAVQEFLVKNTGMKLRFRLRVIPLKEIESVEVTTEGTMEVYPADSPKVPERSTQEVPDDKTLETGATNNGEQSDPEIQYDSVPEADEGEKNTTDAGTASSPLSGKAQENPSSSGLDDSYFKDLKPSTAKPGDQLPGPSGAH